MKTTRFARPSHALSSLACAIALFAVKSSAAPTLFYDAGDPSASEQFMLERINAARINPPAEGNMLADSKDKDVLSYYGYFKVNTGAMRSAFAAYPARAPLAMNKNLMASATRHSQDLAHWGQQQHNGSDGSTFDGRIRDTGYSYSTAAENIYAYSLNALFGHIGLNADWGVPDLGHRNNIMDFDLTDKRNDPSYLFKEIGISVVPTVVTKDNNGKPFGPYIITQDFATPADRSQAFLVGVAYDDKNGNGQYDEGEGLAGVTVTPDQGQYYTVTGAAGGFTIPLPAGVTSMTVTASGGQLGERRVRTVAISPGNNVKVDFHAQDAPSAPAPTSNVYAAALVVDTVVGSGQPGIIKIARYGDLSQPLTVPLTIGGAAIGGVDYAALPSQVTIPAGGDTVEIAVTPLGGRSLATYKKVKVFVSSDTGYTVPNGTSQAKVRILPTAAN